MKLIKISDQVVVLENTDNAEIIDVTTGRRREVRPGDTLKVKGFEAHGSNGRYYVTYYVNQVNQNGEVNYIKTRNAKLSNDCSCSFATLICTGCICEVKR